MTPSWKRISPWAPALVWAATIFVLSSIPGSAYPPTDIVNADKLVHIALYGLLGALCARGFARTTPLGPLGIVAVAAPLATLYGMSDELHQRFVPGRNSDWRDVAADAIGALLGAAVIALVAGHRRRRARAVR
jgi:VanZ family protein